MRRHGQGPHDPESESTMESATTTQTDTAPADTTLTATPQAAEKASAQQVRPTPPKTPRPVPAPRVDSPLITALIAEAVSCEELNARIVEVVSEGTPIIEPVHREDGTVNENERIVTFLYHNEQAEQVLMFINRLTERRTSTVPS